MPIIQQTRLYALLCLLMLPLMALHADTLQDFTAVYHVEKYDSDIGRTTYQLEQQADEVHFSMRTELTGFFALFRKDRVEENSWLKRVGGALQLQRYSYVHEGSKRNRNTQISIQWPPGSSQGTANGSHADRAISFDVDSRVRDALSFQLSLMLDLARDAQTLDYPVLSKDELKHYSFTRAGAETLSLGGREIKTLIVERQSGERTTRLWLAPDFQYTPVKIELLEDDDSDTSMRIDTLTLNGKQAL